MKRLFASSVLLLSVACLGACASNSATDAAAQELVDTISASNADITRLTIHAKPAGSEDFVAIASSASAKRGKVSDPEDLEAMKTGELVVLDEPGAIDVTVPIGRDGSGYRMATGVTLRDSVGRASAIETAKRIAAEIERALAK